MSEAKLEQAISALPWPAETLRYRTVTSHWFGRPAVASRVSADELMESRDASRVKDSLVWVNGKR